MRILLQQKTQERLILITVLMTYFMIILDNSIVFTAVENMKMDLHLTTPELSWVSTAYTLTFGSLLLLSGRLGDTFGRKKIFLIGLFIFGFSSAWVGLSTGLTSNILSRGLQGIASSMLAPTTLALLIDNFEAGPKRIKAIGWYGSVAGIGASVGLVLGGVFASFISWRFAFFINVPISLAMIALTMKFIANSKISKIKIDILGAVLSFVGMSGIIFGLSQLTQVVTIGMFSFFIGALLLVIFVIYEKNEVQPLVPLRLFLDRERSSAYLIRLLFLGAMMGFWFFMGQFMQVFLHFSPVLVGIAYFPLTLVNFIVALYVPKLISKYGNGVLLTIGLAITFIGLLLLSFIKSDSNYFISIMIPMAVIGFGQGLAFSPMTNSGIVRALPEDAGVASGLVNVFHQLGGSLGVATLVTIGSALSINFSGNGKLIIQVQTALVGGTIMMGIAFIVSLLFILPKRNNK